jgi:hypothetical protein
LTKEHDPTYTPVVCSFLATLSMSSASSESIRRGDVPFSSSQATNDHSMPSMWPFSSYSATESVSQLKRDQRTGLIADGLVSAGGAAPGRDDEEMLRSSYVSCLLICHDLSLEIKAKRLLSTGLQRSSGTSRTAYPDGRRRVSCEHTFDRVLRLRRGRTV